MVAITFVSPEDDRQVLDIAPGVSVMEGAVRGGVDGIDADCGGELACATCHVYIAPDWAGRLAPPTEAESEMLEFASSIDVRSRLSCQIIATPELEGLVVHLPASQR